MASLVAPLASGVVGAASGTAEFFRAGTSTAATVYSDDEGETPVTAHVLDANGGIERYVRERVDVVVYDSGGAQVRTFTWGTHAGEVRVTNAGFTGPDSTAAIVAGGRTTLDAILSDLAESLGATDGNVLVNGSILSLTAAISSSAGLVYNVKSQYGARGDGITNDTSAVQAALNAAANAGGGIIYFPHGTYLLSTAVSVASGVGKFMYLGESASGVTLKQADGITMLGLGASNQNLLMGLTFAPSSASNTGTLVSVGTSARATFLGCMFSPLNGAHVALGGATSSRASLHSCTISQAGASSRIASGVGYFRMEGCDVTTSGGSLTSFSDATFVISSGTNWAIGAAGSAGTSYIYNNSGSILHVMGGEIAIAFTSGTLTVCGAGVLQISNAIVSSGGATVNLAGAATATLYEAACTFNGTGSAGDSWPETPIYLGNPLDGHSATRGRSYISSTITAASYTPNPDYLLHEVTSNNAAFTLNSPSATPPTGWPLIVVYKNTNAGAVTPAFVAAGMYSYVTAPGSIASGATCVFYFLPKMTGLAGGDLVSISPTTAITSP